jgi:hypothetical protein
MKKNSPSYLVEDAELTPTSNTKGHEIYICDPPWFDDLKKYKINNAPERTASLEFDGADLNYMARVLYAEASGSLQLSEKAERVKEKAAIINVNYFRLNRKGYPNNKYIAKNFREVCDAPGQFESVFSATPKFSWTKKNIAAKLSKRECSDLVEALEAVAAFIESGPSDSYKFDNFRGYNPTGQGLHIGRSRFWLSFSGAAFVAKTP